MTSAASHTPQDGWAKLPPGLSLACDVPAVAVDGRDNVYVFNRGADPMLVFDRHGNLLRTWGQGVFTRPHGVHAGHDGCIYCTDEGDHTVRKCTPEGRVLLTLGLPGQAAPYMSNRPFNRCTHTALAPNGDIYVSDGYGNACVHRFDQGGRLLSTFGGSGIGPGEFNVAHNLVCDRAGQVYVADRENHRVQVFDGAGAFVSAWHDLHRACGLCLGFDAGQTVYVSELGPTAELNRNAPNLGPRISAIARDGTRLGRLADGGRGTGPGQFLSPHGIAIDSHGDLYVGEVSYTVWPRIQPGVPVPAGGFRTLHKWRRSAA
jgi:DNA-binding beta-propeller fold protein YncE